MTLFTSAEKADKYNTIHAQVSSVIGDTQQELLSTVEELNTFENTYLVKKEYESEGARDGEESEEIRLQEYKDESDAKTIALRLKLRSLDVDMCLNVAHAQTEAEKMKAKVEAHETQLDLLKYEQSHFQKEYTDCRGFKSKVDDIQLSSIEEFFARAPDSLRIFSRDTSTSNTFTEQQIQLQQEISQTRSSSQSDVHAHTPMAAQLPAANTMDAHKLMLNRLAWELSERLSLNKQQRRLEKQKAKLEATLVAKRQKDRDLQKELNDLLLAASPIHELLGTSDVEESTYNDTQARLLPPPLHALYLNAVSHKATVDDDKFSVSIKGDTVAAKQAEEKEEAEHGLRTEACSEVVALPITEDLLFSCHPLSVVLKFNDIGKEIVFSFLTRLGIMCACERSFERGISVDMLTNVDPHDTGKRSPNPANDYQMDKVDVLSISECTMKRGFGKPYRWAQYLGGIEYLPTNRQHLLTPDTKRMTLVDFILRLRSICSDDPMQI
eukprot:CFRG0638T1